MNAEIYPMPSFVTLIARDLEASSNFYQNALGFQHIFTMPGPGSQPALVHLRWAKFADLLITAARGDEELPEPKGTGVSLCFSLYGHFEGTIDDFAQRAREQGAQVVDPVDQPWNAREVTVFDPDGYRLVFNTPIDMSLSFDKVVDRARQG